LEQLTATMMKLPEMLSFYLWTWLKARTLRNICSNRGLL